ncbi:ArsR/SmtB family transcription factor [Chondromyces crocatus]|uniref:ArsR/SmtB family transcription factor n=1 Tax=Chondromyces crocatus TaxID=52 RepID=UPI001C54C1FB|nr:metalloregulator ArsR/SmtB family transcription factor [Chondromyces crocatus]
MKRTSSTDPHSEPLSELETAASRREESDPAAPCGGEPHGAPPPSSFGKVAFQRAAALFRALGDVERLKLLESLAQREVCVTELAEASRARMPTVSQRLRVLRAEGLVVQRRDGKHIFYALADQHVVELVRNALQHASELRSPPADDDDDPV